MLARPDPPVDLHVPRDLPQDNLLHNLPRHRGQANRPVVPRILPAALLVDGSHIGKPPVFWDLTRQQGALIDDGKRLGYHLRPFPQHSRVNLIRSHGLVAVQLE
ncbi:Uncharacterised protein [Chlamydia abortus]|nr:Uncharacterised protein [Chlamydia abortus]